MGNLRVSRVITIGQGSELNTVSYGNGAFGVIPIQQRDRVCMQVLTVSNDSVVWWPGAVR